MPSRSRESQDAECALDLRVTGKDVVADGVVTVDLETADGSPLPAWSPGAHIDIRCGEVVRQYSLCGAPGEAGYRIAVRREEKGRGGSRFVHDVLAIGDRIVGHGPRNHFALVDAQRYLLVAGGIGITPLLAMLGELEATGREWELVYGGRTLESMPFRADLAGRFPDRLSTFPEDETGPLDLVALLSDPPAGTAVYCCGPEGLLHAVEGLAGRWCSGATLRVERFAAREVDQGQDEPFEVEIASTGEVLEVPADRAVLDVLDEAGVPVLSSCTEGTCGTCETAVLSGAVDHRDALLAEDERAANDVMFVCVSRSLGDRLVLDL